MSVVVDPILVPYFQKRVGNGGLGVCIATVLSEILMMGVGIYLLPRGIFTRNVLKGMALAVVGGCAMAAAAWVLRGITPFVAAPLSTVVYFGCLYLTGGLEKDQIALFTGALGRKFKRKQAAA